MTCKALPTARLCLTTMSLVSIITADPIMVISINIESSSISGVQCFKLSSGFIEDGIAFQSI